MNLESQKERLLDNDFLPMIIGQDVCTASHSEGIPIWNPSNGKLISRVQAGDAHTVDKAVNAALSPIKNGEWPGSPRDRAKLLVKFCELIERDRKLLSNLDTLSIGLTTERSEDEVNAIIEDIEYFAGWCTKLEGRCIPTSDPSNLALTTHTSIGICAAITSWNWPMEGFSAKIAPAIAAGNCVILKPAEQAAPSALWLGKLALEAGFPPGVINVITGEGPVVASALAKHPLVDAVTFTGATKTGAKVASLAAGKRISLQLSGTCYAIVFEDANLPIAAKQLVVSAFDHSGQNCIAPSRIFVQQSVLDLFLEAVSIEIDKFHIGDPFSSNVKAGPLISKSAQSRIYSLLENAEQCGGKIVTRGNLDPSASKTGFFVPPHVVTGLPKDHSLVTEEVYGPIMSILSFGNEAEVLKRSFEYNNALGVGIWTQNIHRAQRLSQSIQSGTIWINGYGVYDSAIPVGGWGHYGLGRELGAEALDFYLQKKSIWFIGC